ncbi:MAG: GTP cyclohydrolase I FolE [Myxococcales bacterium]|nr:GTP cyclohydrolase I FolE [Myxococcales bacterium]
MDDRTDRAQILFREGFEKILEGLNHLGYDTVSDVNFTETRDRAARALGEMARPRKAIDKEISEMLARTFPARYDEMVISKQNVAFGLCPHHLLPVVYRISVAYIPREKVLGISKLSRLCTVLARRPMLQEDLTHDLSRILHEQLESRGAAAYIEGLHLCMAARGIGAHEARVVTSAVRGVFRDNAPTRQEFLDLVTAPAITLV